MLQKLPPVKLNVLGQANGQGTGAKRKPDWCQFCPRFDSGANFVPDYIPAAPKIALLLPKPEKDDAANFESGHSALGRFLYNILLREAGLTREDVLLAHVLRCYSWEYPIGADKGKSERACRNFDRSEGKDGRIVNAELSLESWGPNVFIPTFDVRKCLEIGAFYALALEDIRKALRFAESGYRPLVAMGSEVMLYLAPWLEGSGGIKNWRGHWWEGDWRGLVSEEVARVQGGFIPVAADYKRKPWGRKKPAVKKIKETKQGDLFSA